MLKRVIALILTLAILGNEMAIMASVPKGNSCSTSLNEVRTTLRDIAGAGSDLEVGQIIKRFMVELSYLKTKEIETSQKETIDKMTRAYDELAQCGVTSACILRVERSAYKIFTQSRFVKLVRQILVNLTIGERAKKKLQSTLKEISQEVSQGLSQLPPADVEDIYLKINQQSELISRRLNSYFDYKQFFLAERRSQKAITRDAVSSWSWFLHYPEVRFDYMKGLAIALFTQVMAVFYYHRYDLLSDPSFSFFQNVNWYLWPTTALAMLIQSEIGARNTLARPGAEESQTSPNRNWLTFEGRMQELPKVLQGEDGYIRQSVRRAAGYTVLLPWIVSFATITNGIQDYWVLSELLPQSSIWQPMWYQMLSRFVVNIVTFSLFEAYLVTRFSLLDRGINLRYFPTAIESLKMAERASKEKLDLYKAQNPELSFFEVRQSAEAREFRAYQWQRRRMQAVENIGWRMGLGFFDSLFVYWLITDAVPSTLGLK